MARINPERADSTLTLAVADFLNTCRSVNTQAAYRADLDHLATWCRQDGHLDLLTIDVHDIARYRAECETAGASPATIARRLSAIASFTAYTAVSERAPALLAGTNIPRPTVAPNSTADLLTDADADALLAAADQRGSRSAVAIRLLMLDGLKVGEVIRADATDVHGRQPHSTIRLRTHPARTITMHHQTAKALQRYLGRRRQGPLILSEQRGRESERLTRFGLDYLVKHVAQTARLEQRISSNTLRRRYVTAAHAQGNDLATIRHNTGHTDTRTTRRYLPHNNDNP